MTLVNSKELLGKAKREGYAVPQFNASDMEIVLAIVRAAGKLKSPVIIGSSEHEADHSGEEYLSKIVEVAAKGTTIPIAMHLDHGKSFERVENAVKAGYTSVHIDASELSYEENVGLTKKVAKYAHKNDIQAEGELGQVLTPKSDNEKVDRSQYFTDPDKVAEYVDSTGVDSLAISIGTAHGAYKGNADIDFARLKKINENSKVPLVLHGASFLKDNDVKKAIKNGISKININTELRFAYTNAFKDFTEKHPEEYVPNKIMDKVIEEMISVCEEKIKLFGSENKA